jgi:hypothetical protein
MKMISKTKNKIIKENKNNEQDNRLDNVDDTL